MFDIQEELKKMPDNPGVYIMKDEKEEIIYVGKAVILKNRVRQYFQNSKAHSPKVRHMVSKIKEFEYIVTDTELEALILECNLIKEYRPKYNILLKDDKSYPYIKVTMNEDYPRVFMTRRVEKDGAKYFGPYTSVYAVKEVLLLLNKIFPIKSCKKKLPQDIGKSRPCLNYHIEQCIGPCTGKVDREEYYAMMEDVCDILNGKHRDIVRKLERAMNNAAEKLEYEKAALYRNRLNSLKLISEKQKVLTGDGADRDVIGISADENTSGIQVFIVRGGKLIGREHFIFDQGSEENSRELLASFIKQYYSDVDFIPGEVLLPHEADDSELIEQWLSAKKGKKVRLAIPQRGEKLKLVEMASQNAQLAVQQNTEKKLTKNASVMEGLNELAEAVGLDKRPERIEAFDISNTGRSEITAAMAVFENGLAAKEQYRRYKIKTLEKPDDYAAMQEVIYRRYKNGKDALPDLLLIDGGLGHVNAVTSVLNDLQLTIRVAGMVKDDKHRTRGLVVDGKEIEIANIVPLFRLVTTIQNEAHRFAISYNKKLREKRYRHSVLDDIPGVGEKRKKELLKHFGSVKNIQKAEMDDLLAVSGINKSTAENIINFFAKDKKE
jgi:excinuclease ABC subunit C